MCVYRGVLTLRAEWLDLPYSVHPVKTKAICVILGLSPYPAVNTFHLGYKNQSVYAVSGTSRCLFSDKYKTHKYILTLYRRSADRFI